MCLCVSHQSCCNHKKLLAAISETACLSSNLNHYSTMLTLTLTLTKKKCGRIILDSIVDFLTKSNLTLTFWLLFLLILEMWQSFNHFISFLLFWFLSLSFFFMWTEQERRSGQLLKSKPYLCRSWVSLSLGEIEPIS